MTHTLDTDIIEPINERAPIRPASLRTRVLSLGATAVIYPLVSLCTATGLIATMAHATDASSATPTAIERVSAPQDFMPVRHGGLFSMEPGA